MTVDFAPQIIARINSPFKEKFGIPRQSGLVDMSARVEMLPPFDDPQMFHGLDSFSHIWLTFLFHGCMEQGWHKRVRPPRLGGNQSMGVFATRAPYRPNHIGLSAVQLVEVDISTGGVCLEVIGADLLDDTPIIDIKPYIPYADALPQASGGFASEAPKPVLAVEFSPSVAEELQQMSSGQALHRAIEQLIALDPRPAYQSRSDDSSRIYGMRLDNHNICWRVEKGVVTVLGIDKISQ